MLSSEASADAQPQNSSQPKSQREKALEASLFGTESFYESKLCADLAEPLAGDTSAPLFYIDTTRSADLGVADDVENLHLMRNATVEDEPAWIDEEADAQLADIAAAKRFKKLRTAADETVISTKELEQRLKGHIEKINSVPKWAKNYDAETDAAAQKDSVLSGTAPFGILAAKDSAKGRELPADKLDISRLKNANVTFAVEAPVKSLEFHPNGNILLASGFKTKMALFKIGQSDDNDKLQSIQFKDMTVESAFFTSAGKEIVCTGKKPHFYVYNLEQNSIQKIPKIRGRNDKAWHKFKVSPSSALIAFIGSAGDVVVVSNATKQMICSFSLNCAVACVAFSPDERLLYCLGADNHTVYVWDLMRQGCVQSIVDNEGLQGTTLDVSRDGKTLACGFDSGIVSLYDASQAGTLDHTKAIGNLTTSVGQVTFNFDSKLMGISSSAKKNQFKLLHTGTNRIFSNWPTTGTPLGFISCFAFSDHHGYLSFGNTKGSILLYKLNHYNSA